MVTEEVRITGGFLVREMIVDFVWSAFYGENGTRLYRFEETQLQLQCAKTSANLLLL